MVRKISTLGNTKDKSMFRRFVLFYCTYPLRARNMMDIIIETSSLTHRSVSHHFYPIYQSLADRRNSNRFSMIGPKELYAALVHSAKSTTHRTVLEGRQLPDLGGKRGEIAVR